MPYIKPDARERLDALVQAIKDQAPVTVGELNYLITNLLHAYVDDSYSAPSYNAFNDVVGVLECAKMEFYRRYAVPYEVEKMRQNGDVVGVLLKDQGRP